MNDNYLMHYGVLGMKWGVRRYQNADGSLKPAGKKHFGIMPDKPYEIKRPSNKLGDDSLSKAITTGVKIAKDVKAAKSAKQSKRQERASNAADKAKRFSSYAAEEAKNILLANRLTKKDGPKLLNHKKVNMMSWQKSIADYR